jgi:hypothetical protein
MQKPPAFLFYVKDWNSSPTVAAMKMHHRGIYATLLAAAWDSEEPGTLPLPLDVAARSARIDIRSLRDFAARYIHIAVTSARDRDEIAVRSLRDRLEIDARSLRCFVDLEGKLVNHKLREQWLEILKDRQNQSDAGKKGNIVRWGKSSGGESGADRFAFASSSALASASTPNKELMMTHQSLEPVEKIVENQDPPQKLYGRLENWKVPFGADSVRVLWKVCQKELPTLTVPALMWELELAWDKADKPKIGAPVAFLVEACRGAFHHQALYPKPKRKTGEFENAGSVLKRIAGP